MRRFINHGSVFVEIQAIRVTPVGRKFLPNLFSNSSEPHAHKVDGQNLHVPIRVNPRNYATFVYLYLP